MLPVPIWFSPRVADSVLSFISLVTLRESHCSGNSMKVVVASNNAATALRSGPARFPPMLRTANPVLVSSGSLEFLPALFQPFFDFVHGSSCRSWPQDSPCRLAAQPRESAAPVLWFQVLSFIFPPYAEFQAVFCAGSGTCRFPYGWALILFALPHGYQPGVLLKEKPRRGMLPGDRLKPGLRRGFRCHSSISPPSPRLPVFGRTPAGISPVSRGWFFPGSAWSLRSPVYPRAAGRLAAP